MTKDEALKLALEALENHSGNYKLNKAEGAKQEIAITSIKEALAQPEQEPVAWMDDYNACKCPDNEARCFSDKVFRMMQKHTDSLVKRQEPVAKVCHDLDGHIGWNPNLKQLPNEGTPLYTTPPPVAEPHKRKPLTDEQIGSCIDEVNLTSQYGHHHFGWHKQFARAIEAAHGIYAPTERKGEA